MEKLCTAGIVAGVVIGVYGLTHPATVHTASTAVPRTESAAPAIPPAAVALAAPDLKAVAGQQYLAAVTAYDATLVSVRTRLHALSQNAFPAAVPVVQVLLGAMRTEQLQVQAIQFPATAQADATVELQRLEANLAAADTFVRSPNAATWKALNATFPLATAASNTLRADLGLPSAPSV